MKTHLIADDNEMNRMVLKMVIEQITNDKILEVDDGLKVIELITNNEKIDYIWLDLKMAGMDGIKCAKLLRDNASFNGKIIGVTGHTDEETKKECFDVGMHGFCSKPFFVGDIQKILTQI